MRKRLTMLWTIGILGVALVLPATTAAANPSLYRAVVKLEVCEVYSVGRELTLKVKAKEFGYSSTNYFAIRSKVQKKQLGGYWRTEYDWGWEYSTAFPDDGVNYYHVLKRTYTARDNATWHRIVMRVQFWSFEYGLIAERVVRGTACS